MMRLKAIMQYFRSKSPFVSRQKQLILVRTEQKFIDFRNLFLKSITSFYRDV
jgi:hypothetical protein